MAITPDFYEKFLMLGFANAEFKGPEPYFFQVYVPMGPNDYLRTPSLDSPYVRYSLNNVLIKYFSQQLPRGHHEWRSVSIGRPLLFETR